MPLSAEQQSLFDHARNSLPRFLTRGAGAVLEWLHGFTQIFDAARSQAADWLDMSYISQATGRWLDQHARDRGTSRRDEEDDPTLRARIRQFEDLLTYPAMKAAVDAILAGAGVSGTCDIVMLRRDRGHFHTVGLSRAFFGRGYRMANANRPMGYVVILPYGTTDATGQAVLEYLRQYGPAGYVYYVEIRQNP